MSAALASLPHTLLLLSVGSSLQFHAESELLCTQKFAALEPVFFFILAGRGGVSVP
jgi:hypothetical protein